MLVAPVREGVTRGGNGGQPVFAGDLRDGGAQMLQSVARLGDVAGDRGSDLDLAAQEFRADLILQPGLAVLHQRVRRLGQVAGFGIDEQIFLFDAKREVRFRTHLLAPFFDRRASLRPAMAGGALPPGPPGYLDKEEGVSPAP